MASNPGKWSHQALLLDGVRKLKSRVLDTDAVRRLYRFACEGTGCEDVTLPAGDMKQSILADRTLSNASRWREIMTLNGPEGTGHGLGDCLALPLGGHGTQGFFGSSMCDCSGSLERAEASSPARTR